VLAATTSYALPSGPSDQWVPAALQGAAAAQAAKLMLAIAVDRHILELWRLAELLDVIARGDAPVEALEEGELVQRGGREDDEVIEQIEEGVVDPSDIRADKESCSAVVRLQVFLQQFKFSRQHSRYVVVLLSVIFLVDHLDVSESDLLLGIVDHVNESSLLVILPIQTVFPRHIAQDGVGLGQLELAVDQLGQLSECRLRFQGWPVGEGSLLLLQLDAIVRTDVAQSLGAPSHVEVD